MAKVGKWRGEKIEERHIREAAKRWSSGETLGFRSSAKYDVYIDNAPFPPKAICALALESASGQRIRPRDFLGADDGYWHQILKKWFKVIPKYSNSMESLETQTNELLSVDPRVIEAEANRHSSQPTLRKTTTVNVFVRSPYVRAAALLRANGICQDCSEPAPFKKKSNGQPYLEVHHIKPLSQGGADSTQNTIALCPNCHSKRHDSLGLVRDDD